jgi:hypothetical protein
VRERDAWGNHYVWPKLFYRSEHLLDVFGSDPPARNQQLATCANSLLAISGRNRNR